MHARPAFGDSCTISYFSHNFICLFKNDDVLTVLYWPTSVNSVRTELDSQLLFSRPLKARLCFAVYVYSCLTETLLLTLFCKCTLLTSAVRALTVSAPSPHWLEMFQPGTDDTIINSIS